MHIKKGIKKAPRWEKKNYQVRICYELVCRNNHKLKETQHMTSFFTLVMFKWMQSPAEVYPIYRYKRNKAKTI